MNQSRSAIAVTGQKLIVRQTQRQADNRQNVIDYSTSTVHVCMGKYLQFVASPSVRVFVG